MGPWSKTDWDLNQQNATKRETCIFLGMYSLQYTRDISRRLFSKEIRKDAHTSSGRVRVM